MYADHEDRASESSSKTNRDVLPQGTPPQVIDSERDARLDVLAPMSPQERWAEVALLADTLPETDNLQA